MSCGWKKFAAFNGLREGDCVVFCLRALSEFEVFVCPGAPGSPGSSVEGLCEPMQKLLALEDCTVAAAGSLHTTTSASIQRVMDFHPDFPMVSTLPCMLSLISALLLNITFFRTRSEELESLLRIGILDSHDVIMNRRHVDMKRKILR